MAGQMDFSLGTVGDEQNTNISVCLSINWFVIPISYQIFPERGGEIMDKYPRNLSKAHINILRATSTRTAGAISTH